MFPYLDKWQDNPPRRLNERTPPLLCSLQSITTSGKFTSEISLQLLPSISNPSNLSTLFQKTPLFLTQSSSTAYLSPYPIQSLNCQNYFFMSAQCLLASFLKTMAPFYLKHKVYTLQRGTRNLQRPAHSPTHPVSSQAIGPLGPYTAPTLAQLRFS